MIYALRSPETKLNERQEIANQIREAIRIDDLEALRGDSRLIYVWDNYSPRGFCIYCNTAVSTLNIDNYPNIQTRRKFRHNHHSGGVPRAACEQIAHVLGMVPIYDLEAYEPPEE